MDGRREFSLNCLPQGCSELSIHANILFIDKDYKIQIIPVDILQDCPKKKRKKTKLRPLYLKSRIRLSIIAVYSCMLRTSGEVKMIREKIVFSFPCQLQLQRRNFLGKYSVFFRDIGKAIDFQNASVKIDKHRCGINYTLDGWTLSHS